MKTNKFPSVWTSDPYQVASTETMIDNSTYQMIFRLTHQVIANQTGKTFQGTETFYKVADGPSSAITIPILFSLNRHNQQVTITETGAADNSAPFTFIGTRHGQCIDLIGSARDPHGQPYQIVTTLTH